MTREQQINQDKLNMYGGGFELTVQTGDGDEVIRDGLESIEVSFYHLGQDKFEHNLKARLQ